MQGTLIWNTESDEVGGLRQYSNNKGATKSFLAGWNKVWVYGATDPNHGVMNIQYADENVNIDTHSDTRAKITLLYESELHPYSIRDLIIIADGTSLVTCVYYMYDPPAQTPAPGPSRTPLPDADLNFINNQFQNEQIPNQLVIGANSNIKQISGCTFTNIKVGTRIYFIKLATEIPFFQNTFEYSRFSDDFSMPIWMNYNGKLTISRCKFVKCIHHSTASATDDGNAFNVNSGNVVDVTFDFCDFIDCGNRKDMAVVGIKNGNSDITFSHCLFAFEDSTMASKVLTTRSSNVVFDGCQFNKTGCIDINCQTNGTFEFTGNTITSITQQFLYAINVASDPVFSGNTFQNCNYNDGTNAFINFNHHLDEIELIDNTFSFQTMSAGNQYGGGIEAWFQNVDGVETVLKYIDCNFNDNKNQYTESPYSNGGAIQIGYTTSLSSTTLIFRGCRFLRNQCSSGKGGALSLSVHQNVTIENCLFQDNSAQTCGAIYIWGKTNSENSDSDTQLKQEMITITNCRFIGNNGGDVSAILIEEENFKVGTVFISNTSFTNANSNSQKIIQGHCSNIEIQHSTFDETSKSIILYIRGNSHINGCQFTTCRCLLLGNTESNNEFDIFIENNIFERSSSTTKGGSLLIDHSEVQQPVIQYHFRGCTFDNNNAQEEGGAIAVLSDITTNFDDCIFTNNQATGEGGAINIGRGTINNCQFTSNKGSDGNSIGTYQTNIADSELNILGCTFTNNGEVASKYNIISYCKIVNFENNEVKYLDESKTSGAINCKQPRAVSFINSNFNKCITQSTSVLGLDENWKSYENVEVHNCEFINCRRLNNGFTIFIPNCEADFDNVTISFESASKSNGGINFGNKGFNLRNSRIIRAKHDDGAIKFIQASGNTNPITINNCVFEDCGNQMNRLCFKISLQSTTGFTFENNVIQNMKSQGNSKYLCEIDFNNKINTFSINNLTLVNNSCNSDYGGGTGLRIISVGKIIFDHCNFINNEALRSTTSRTEKPSNKEYFSGDGGGIQYGFSTPLYNMELQFTGCLFGENKAVRHGGAIAIQMNNKVVIDGCTFENNIANYQQTSSQILYDNYFDLKTEGRGGAIYINPTFTYGNTNGKDICY